MAGKSVTLVEALDGIRDVLERLAQTCASRTIEHPPDAKGSEVIKPEPVSAAPPQTYQEAESPAARQPQARARRKRRS
jgi:hypothetical protein